MAPGHGELLHSAHFLDQVFEAGTSPDPGLAFAQAPPRQKEALCRGSLYLMDTRGIRDGVELMTGLGASGCHVIVVFTTHFPCFPLIRSSQLLLFEMAIAL